MPRVVRHAVVVDGRRVLVVARRARRRLWPIRSSPYSRRAAGFASRTTPVQATARRAHRATPRTAPGSGARWPPRLPAAGGWRTRCRATRPIASRVRVVQLQLVHGLAEDRVDDPDEPVVLADGERRARSGTRRSTAVLLPAVVTVAEVIGRRTECPPAIRLAATGRVESGRAISGSIRAEIQVRDRDRAEVVALDLPEDRPGRADHRVDLGEQAVERALLGGATVGRRVSSTSGPHPRVSSRSSSSAALDDRDEPGVLERGRDQGSRLAEDGRRRLRPELAAPAEGDRRRSAAPDTWRPTTIRCREAVRGDRARTSSGSGAVDARADEADRARVERVVDGRIRLASTPAIARIVSGRRPCAAIASYRSRLRGDHAPASAPVARHRMSSAASRPRRSLRGTARRGHERRQRRHLGLEAGAGGDVAVRDEHPRCRLRPGRGRRSRRVDDQLGAGERAALDPLDDPAAPEPRPGEGRTDDPADDVRLRRASRPTGSAGG